MSVLPPSPDHPGPPPPPGSGGYPPPAPPGGGYPPPPHAPPPVAPPPEAQTNRPVLRALNVGEVLDTAVRVYRSQWRTFIAVAAIVLVPLNFLQFFLFRDLYDAFTTPGGLGTVAPRDLQQMLVVSGVATLITLLLVTPFLTAAMAKAAADSYLGERTGIGETFRFALRRAGPLLWVMVLFGLVIVAILAPLVALVVAAPGSNTVGLLAVPVMIVVIFVGVRLFVSTTVLVVEDERGPRALGRSWRLTSGRFWRLFGALILANLIGGVVARLIVEIFGLAAPSAGSSGWVVDAAGSALAQVVVQPFSTLVAVVLYFDLRVRKEGFDLALLARGLNSARS